MTPPLLRAQNLSKHFSGTPALQNVSFNLQPAEIVGLIGENGAGKSTLIKILSGVHSPDGGSLEFCGEPLKFRDPREALARGIATIHQELAFFEKLTVSENLLMHQSWPRKRLGAVDWRRFHGRAQQLLDEFGLGVRAEALVSELSPAQRQEISILRALSQNAKLLILDEPTAALTEPEVLRLLKKLEQLRAQGVGIIYVSHRLEEVLKICNRVLVLRDGALVGAYSASEATLTRMIREMVGRELSQQEVRTRRKKTEKPCLEVRNLSRAGMFQNVSLALHGGEILGLAGLVGAGRSELGRTIYGLYQPDSGEIQLSGHPTLPSGPGNRRRAGIVYVPEERKRQGFVLDHSTRSSISIGFLDALSKFGLISSKKERARVQNGIERFGIRIQHMEQSIGTLSGGNQQKALLARCLEIDPQVVILDEPTRGVDIGAKSEIYRLIDELAARGKAILLISSDLPEILALSDRIMVLHKGRITAEFSQDEASQEKVLTAASGVSGTLEGIKGS